MPGGAGGAVEVDDGSAGTSERRTAPLLAGARTVGAPQPGRRAGVRMPWNGSMMQGEAAIVSEG